MKKDLLDSPLSSDIKTKSRRKSVLSGLAVSQPAETAGKPVKRHKYKVYSHKPKGRGLFTQSEHFDVHYLNSSKELEEFALSLSERGFMVRGSGANYWVMPGAIMRIEQVG